KARMRRFVYGLGRHVVEECAAALLQKDIDIAGLMDYFQQTEDAKLANRLEREQRNRKRSKSSVHDTIIGRVAASPCSSKGRLDLLSP
ncbi:hypothetical protein HAX54_039936, partial [Datura stramonium]|nr:hypothetical protein [Datura stramonium]